MKSHYNRKTVTDPHAAQHSKLNYAKQHYRCTNNSKDDQQKAIRHQTIQSRLDYLLSASYPHRNDDLNQAVQDINNIFKNVADLSYLRKSQKSQPMKSDSIQTCRHLKTLKRFIKSKNTDKLTTSSSASNTGKQ